MNTTHLTRREFLRIAGLTSVGVVAAACAPVAAPTSAPAVATGAPTQPPATAAATRATGQGKSPTDSLTVALSTLEAETFLPWNGGGGRSPYLAMIYEYLIYIDPKTEEPKPGLAASWEMSPDAKTWTFNLRKGVQFAENNGELTADDVKYSIERISDPKSIAGPASQLRALVEKIEAPSPYQVVITLKSPYPELDRGILSDGNQVVIVSKKYLDGAGEDKANAHPIGSGPFTLAEPHQKGGPIKLTTIPNVEQHWRVHPEFKNVTFMGVPEEATRIAMLKTGEADLAPISFDSLDTVKASGLHIISVQKTWVPVVRFGGLIATDPKRYNPNNPWAKKEVRQALNHAVDKDAIVKNIFHGEAVPAATPIPIASWFDIAPYPYDPTKAKQLLAQAGYPNGFPVTLKTFTTDPGAQLPTIGEAVALYWKAIGINVTIVPTDWATVRGEWTGGKANDYVWTHRGFGFPGLLSGLNPEFSTKQVFASYSTDETEAWLAKAANEMDPQKRAEIVKDLGTFVRDEAADVFIAYANEPYGASSKVGQWQPLRVRPQNIDLITHS